MKLECGLEKIKNAISQTERITGKNLALPVLNSILLIASNKSLKLRSTNLSLGIEVEIEILEVVELTGRATHLHVFLDPTPGAGGGCCPFRLRRPRRGRHAQRRSRRHLGGARPRQPGAHGGPVRRR